MQLHHMCLGLLVVVLSGCGSVRQGTPDAPVTVELRLISQPSAQSFANGEILLFEGRANAPIHRPGPEHFRLQMLSEPTETLELTFGSVKDSYTEHGNNTAYRYNALWRGIQFYIAPSRGGALGLLQKSDYMVIGTAVDLRSGQTYRVTWACWPKGAVSAVEAQCDFQLK